MENISTVAIKFIGQTEGLSLALAKAGVEVANFDKKTQQAMIGASKAIAAATAAAATMGVVFEALVARQLVKAVESLSDIYDQSKKLGVTAEAMQAINIAAISSGTQIESFRANFVHLTKAIEEVDNGNQKVIDGFNKMGISVDKLKQLTPDKQFAAIINALGQVDDQTQRAEAALIVFGRQYSEIRQIVEGGTEAMAAAAEAGAAFGRVIGEEDVINVKKLDIAMNNLKEASQGMFNMLVASAAPMITQLINDLMKWAKESYGIFNLLQDILYAITTPLYMIAVAADYLIAAFLNVKAIALALSAVGVGIATAFTKGFEFVVQGWENLVNIIIAGWNKLPFNTKVDYVDFTSSIGQAGDDLKNTMKELVKQSNDTFNEAAEQINHGYADKLTDATSKIVGNMGNVVKSANEAGQAAADSIRKVGDAAKGVTPDIIDLDAMWEKAMHSWMEYVKSQKRTAEKYDPVSKYRDEIAAIQELMAFQEETKYQLYDNARLTEALQLAQTKMIIAQSSVFSNFSGALKNFGDGIADAIMASKSMSEVLRNLAKDIISVIVKQYLLKSLFNSVGSAFGLPALGSLMYGNPAPIGKAVGGQISAGKTYVVGEKGPELFIPNTGGYIVPNGMSAGQSNTVVQNIYVETGVSQTVRAEMASLLPRFKQEALAGVLDAKSRGGSYARGLST